VSAIQRLAPAAAQRRLWGHLDRHTAICPHRRMPRAASLFAPYFRRRNGPSSRTASATKRMRQVSKLPSGKKGGHAALLLLMLEAVTTDLVSPSA
jgi:hypothetical protein